MWSKIKNLYSDVAFAIKTTFNICPKLYALSIFFVILGAILPFFSAKLLADVIDALIKQVTNPGVTGTSILTIAIIYASVELIRSLTKVVYNYFDRVIWNKTSVFLEAMHMKKKSSLDMATIEDKQYADLESRALSRGFWPLAETTNSLFSLLSPIIGSIIAFSLIGKLDLKMLLVLILAVIPLSIAQANYGKSNYNIWNSDGGTAWRQYGEYKNYIIFSKSLIESKLYKSVNFFFNKSMGVFLKGHKKSNNVVNEYYRDRIISEIVNGLGSATIIILLTSHILEGSISVGLLAFYLSIINQLRDNTITLSLEIARQSEKVLSIKDIREWLAVESKIKTPNPVNLNLVDPMVAPKIEFRDVSFKYPNDTNYILRNLSFTLNPGDKLGLVGENGAGKTTMIKLLLRYYDPTDGDIFINNINLRNIEPDNWYEYVIALMQDYSNYNLTTKEAIAISDIDKNIDESWVKESARRSSAHDIIEKWEDKYDQQLGRNFGGKSLSVGQMQKFALARTFYKRAPVIILDEPTAAIDMKSEIEIFNSLELLPTTSIVIYISHDMSTIMKANKIFVLDKENIIERGTHAKLMALNGQYAHLYKEQVKSLGI